MRAKAVLDPAADVTRARRRPPPRLGARRVRPAPAAAAGRRARWRGVAACEGERRGDRDGREPGGPADGGRSHGWKRALVRRVVQGDRSGNRRSRLSRGHTRAMADRGGRDHRIAVRFSLPARVAHQAASRRRRAPRRNVNRSALVAVGQDGDAGGQGSPSPVSSHGRCRSTSRSSTSSGGSLDGVGGGASGDAGALDGWRAPPGRQ